MYWFIDTIFPSTASLPNSLLVLRHSLILIGTRDGHLIHLPTVMANNEVQVGVPRLESLGLMPAKLVSLRTDSEYESALLLTDHPWLIKTEIGQVQYDSLVHDNVVSIESNIILSIALDIFCLPILFEWFGRSCRNLWWLSSSFTSWSEKYRHCKNSTKRG